MGGMGLKIPDHMVIPVTRASHTALHGANREKVGDYYWEAIQSLKTLHRALQEGVLKWVG